jgi:hypothetical protein
MGFAALYPSYGPVRPPRGFTAGARSTRNDASAVAAKQAARRESAHLLAILGRAGIDAGTVVTIGALLWLAAAPAA